MVTLYEIIVTEVRDDRPVNLYSHSVRPTIEQAEEIRAEIQRRLDQSDTPNRKAYIRPIQLYEGIAEMMELVEDEPIDEPGEEEIPEEPTEGDNDE